MKGADLTIMKRFLVLLIGLFLIGCTQSEEEQSYVFTGEIISIHYTDEPWSAVAFSEDIGDGGYPEGAEVSIQLDENEEWEVGDQVRVTHEGPILESYPLGTNQIDIEKME